MLFLYKLKFFNSRHKTDLIISHDIVRDVLYHIARFNIHLMSIMELNAKNF